ncbi:TraM recognition domain-containing protein [Bacteroides fragilis]|nr:TraM recognition domain-containing protein [Bacteroides fragilis]
MVAGLFLYWGSELFLTAGWSVPLTTLAYVSALAAGYICLLTVGMWTGRLLKEHLMDDVFNEENESFMQETRLITNEYSVNLPTRFYYKKKWHDGWINVVLPQRGCIVVGSPGSGKSYCVINQFIKQQIEKGYALYCYDFKFPDLSLIVYNHLLKNKDKYKANVQFYVINFDDPRHSHRCNPINPTFMSDIADAYESAYVIMLNLNRTWIQKQGDFFVESPIVLFAAIIWYLKIYENGKYCTFPHAIELLNKPYSDIFTILTSYRELENYLSPFMDAWKGGAMEQLQGQIASAKIPLSRMISPSLYWIMSGDDFTLDINNPDEPKVLCVGNNPDRQNIYSAALGLYNARIVKMVNRKGKLKCSILVDEVPTIYFKGLDTLIATARSNKVAVCLGAQDFSQLVRDYGEKEARVIQNTVGNVFSGQVLGETAKNLSERFGKVLQQRKSVNMTREDTSTSISTQLDSLIPASKISNLSQGMFVGSVCDSFQEKMEQKIFHCEIVVDNARVAAETKAYKPIPVITDFTGGDGKDHMREEIERNYYRIKEEVSGIIQKELRRIENDPNLKHLLETEDDG